MERALMDSSVIAEVGYDAQAEVLEVLFRHGRVYRYLNFPAFMHQRLMEADSIGKFFNAEIKGHYAEVPV